jgi:transposase InsO family protein
MPWKVSEVMDERARFVLEYERGEASMAELCRAYEIARKTGYKWWERYRREGLEGLRDLGRAPDRHPNQTPPEIEERVLELRRAHMRWGPRKLRQYLRQRHGRMVWPAASTIGELLKRAGLVRERRRWPKTPPYTQPFAAAEGPNQVWCGDFKGWFRTRDGERIDPLTLSDAHSRYLLRCQAVKKTDTEAVRGICEAAFREYGLPWAIRTDNGAPFASRAVAGLSRLAVYWMKLGIVPERIEPGHPEQNGRHERMHRTLKEETASPAAANRRAQQRVFDRFRSEYNDERPHEALGQRTPGSVYVPSLRQYPERVPEPEYDEGLQVRRVYPHGQFKWHGQDVFLSEVLAGEPVGLEQLDERYWCVYFATFPIAVFDSEELTILSLPEIKEENRRRKSGNLNGRDSQIPSATTATTGNMFSDEKLKTAGQNV